jgi:AcrR family transcriptional regulator
MRYPREHKRQTRERILREARRLFRAHGYEGVGIEAIMEAAGLTRGGFYGHFRSKAELFRETLREGHDLLDRLRARPGRTRATLAREGIDVVHDYLDPAHRGPVGRGCSLAALAADTARAGRGPRRAFAETVRGVAEELGRGLRDPEPDDPRALAALALCVGGLLLSRAVGDPGLADAISRACATAAEERLSSAPGRPAER